MFNDNLPPDTTILVLSLNQLWILFSRNLQSNWCLIFLHSAPGFSPSTVLVSMPFLHSAGVLLPRAFVLEAPSAWNVLPPNRISTQLVASFH